jgi:hypothetical protein
VNVGFRRAGELGAKIAAEMSGKNISFQGSFFDLAKTSWFADPTFYPETFCRLLQSDTVHFEDHPQERSRPSMLRRFQHPIEAIWESIFVFSHKTYCYCRYAPNTCKGLRSLVWS